MNLKPPYSLLVGVIGVAWACGASTAAAQSAENWLVLPMIARGVDDQTADIFRELLQNELSARTRAGFLNTPRTCTDVPCAINIGQQLGADQVAFGSLSQLGQKIIVTVSVVDVTAGEVASAQKITVDRIEDLDAAAERIASAVVTGTSTDETAELGNITAQESRPERRREGLGGGGIRVGGLVPFEDGYANGLPGAVIDFSYWYEATRFAIEPRLGFRFDASGQEGNYLEIPMDVGAYYILGGGDFAPYVGGGAGLRYLSDRRDRTFVTGDVIVSTNEVNTREAAFGFGAFARVGALLFRTYTLRIALNVDYNVTFVDVNGVVNPSSVTAGIGVYF